MTSGGLSRPRRARYLLASLLAVMAIAVGAPVVGQSDRLLYIDPAVRSIAPGESIEISAWFCRRLDGGQDFGPDEMPGTDDDRCQRARRTTWSTGDARIARVRPRRGATVTLTGRRDGLTTLEASFAATATATFVRRTNVDVQEPLPDAGRGDEPSDGDPGVDVTVAVDPPFSVLPPGGEQVFVAYVCPLIGEGDARGQDMVPGSADDFCKPAVAVWNLFGEPILGTLDPDVGVATVFRADDDDEPTAFLGATDERPSTTMSNTIEVDVGGVRSGASIIVDPDAPEATGPRPGDVDGDGDVDRDDILSILERLGDRTEPGSSADLDGDGMITFIDARRLMLRCDRPGCATR